MTEGENGRGEKAAHVERDRILDEAIIRIREKRLAEAETLLKSLLPDEDASGEDDAALTLFFNEPIEEIYYRFKFKPKKEIRRNPGNSRFFLTYAYLLMERKDFEGALKVLGKGLARNPIDTDLLFEEGEIFKIKRSWTVFKKMTDLCLAYAYRSSGIARAYRNYGYMFLELGDHEGAACCYLLSREYEDHAIADNQLNRLSGLMGRGIDKPYYHEHFGSILDERKIQIGPSRDLLNIAGTFALNCEEDGDYRAACYFYGILFDLTKGAEIGKKIEDLKKMMDAPRH